MDDDVERLRHGLKAAQLIQYYCGCGLSSLNCKFTIARAERGENELPAGRPVVMRRRPSYLSEEQVRGRAACVPCRGRARRGGRRRGRRSSPTPPAARAVVPP
jgi:hypothetical protein